MPPTGGIFVSLRERPNRFPVWYNVPMMQKVFFAQQEAEERGRRRSESAEEENPGEESQENSTEEMDGEWGIPHSLREGCRCPCPIGAKAVIAIEKNLGLITLTLTPTPETVRVGTTDESNPNIRACGKAAIPVAYELTGPDAAKLPGIVRKGNVNVIYQLTFYYATPPDRNCCEKGSAHFAGTVTFSGSYIKKPWFRGNPTTITANTSAAINTKKDFHCCKKPGEDCCEIRWRDAYNQSFGFSVPDIVPNIILPPWKGTFSVNGTFSVHIVTVEVSGKNK